MIKYRKVEVTETQLEATSMVCNKCGKTYDMDDWCVLNNFTTIRCSYGYGSPKDMMTLLSHVCEACMDEFYSTFIVQPQEGEALLIGEPPTMPVEYEDESLITSAPVAPGKEDSYESQEETTEEP